MAKRSAFGVQSPSKHSSLKYLAGLEKSRYASHDAKGGIKEFEKSEVRQLISEKSESQASKIKKKTSFGRWVTISKGKSKPVRIFIANYNTGGIEF